MSTKAKTSQSLTDLPPNILTEILVRLPLRTLYVTRSVCKTLLSLSTPNPHFTALHASNAAQILAFQYGGPYKPSYLLRLVEPELGIAASRITDLKPFFQLPEMASPDSDLYGTEEQNCLFLVNSCNGLLFFFKRLDGEEHAVVCNPVTNEYILIPEHDRKIGADCPTESTWLGFSPVADRYKVLRIWSSIKGDPAVLAAQVFEIGSDSWRNVDDDPPWRNLSWESCSTLVNGCIYWHDITWRDIFFFDFEREKFGELALPDEFEDEQFRRKHYRSLGVLGGRLCLSGNDFRISKRVDLWVMRKCGNRDFWRKEFSIGMVGPKGLPALGLFKPLQFLRNGEIVMLFMSDDLVFYDMRTESVRFFGLHRFRMAHKAVAFTPSFVPLKDTLMVDKVLSSYVRPRGDEREP